LSSPPLRLWSGQTLHKRFFPFEREFRYALVLIDVDIDRLDEAGRMSRLFTVNRPGFFSFREADHGGPERTTDLRSWADDLFATAGVQLQGGMIRLVTFPRHFFYKFAPLSLWYGFGPDGDLRGVIYEVRNTFGERHCYVASAGGERSVHFAEKSFYVSPFFDVSGQYRFTLRPPGPTLDVIVENMKDGSRTHLANIKARMLPATTSSFLSLAMKNPMSTLGVTFGIHWQALRLWIRGAGYVSRPAKPERAATVAISDRPIAPISPDTPL
jgi:uncharacterized protein